MTEESEVCTKISEKVKMAGFLEKKGSMLWKRYWFVLEDKLLLYYKSQLEYINLSPCRGSLNMSLVSAVQPRRNTKEPIIHLVSRSQSFILKAKDRAGQEKWLQALLDSIGKQGMASLRFSLDDLPGQMKTMTLPKRLHGGSLDAVWKQPVIPKTKMLDKILGYEEEPDENQNTDSYDPAAVERKSQTLDNRKLDSKLEKLRNAIGGRKTSAIFSNDPAATKVRRESFLHKMFKRSPSKIEKQASQPPTPPPIIDSDIDDPFYDTIDHVKATMEPIKEKPVFGTKILFPEGTMAELKDKLKSKESLEKISLDETMPPELPPRSFSNSMTTTEAVVHKTEPCSEDSEESEVSGHYQTIKKTEKNEEPASLSIPSFEPEYQVINKSKKKKYRNLDSTKEEGSNEVSEDTSTTKQEGTNLFDVEKGLNDLNMLLMRLTEITTAPLTEREELTSWTPTEQLLDVKHSLHSSSYQDVSKALQRSISQEIKAGLERSVSQEVNNGFQKNIFQTLKEQSKSSDNVEGSLPRTFSHDINICLEKSSSQELKEGFPHNLKELSKSSDDLETSLPRTFSHDVNICFENSFTQELKTFQRSVSQNLKEPSKSSDDVEGSLPRTFSHDINACLERSASQELKEGFPQNLKESFQSKSSQDIKEIKAESMERSVSQEIKGSLQGNGSEDVKAGLQRSTSDPDYDVPRSHQPIQAENAVEQHRIIATEFFNKTDLYTECTDSSNSLEPDSLEDKIDLDS